MTFGGYCAYCGQTVDLDLGAAYPVTGFEVTRRKGGTNHIHHRKRVPDVILHPTHLDAYVRALRGEGEQLEFVSE